MKRSILGALLSTIIAVCGCAKQAPIVSGTVRLDGEPMKDSYSGSITFEPIDGTAGPIGGSPIKNGKYSIDRDLTFGKFRVRIYATRKTGVKVISAFLPPDRVEDVESAVEPEYNENSTLVVELVPGVNNHDFDAKERKKLSGGRSGG
jgi:hypothetical protein